MVVILKKIELSKSIKFLTFMIACLFFLAFYYGASFAYFIEDERFKALDHCDGIGTLDIYMEDNKVKIRGNIVVNKEQGEIPNRSGGYMWCNGIIHRFIGKVDLYDYTFESDPSEPLTFTVDREKGYYYTSGKGEVTEPNGKVKIFPDFISALQHKDADVRKAAAMALGELKDPGSLEALIYALKDNDFYVRKAVLEALEKIDPKWRESEPAKKAIPDFISALKNKDADVRMAVREALQNIDPKWRESEAAKKAVPDFISALKDSDPYVREAAALVLGETKDPRSLEPLISALKDENSSVLNTAARALAEIKDPRAIEPLISLLKNIDWSIRKTAIISLRVIDPKWHESKAGKKAVSNFISALKDKDPDVRFVAAWALGEIKDPRAIEPLISTLKDENSDVCWEAVEALAKITWQNFGVDSEQWQKWWQQNKWRFLK